MSSILRDFIPIPDITNGRFWCIDTAFIDEEPGVKDMDPYYETMVFSALEMLPGSRHQYDINWNDLDMTRTNDRDEAYENHKKMIEKWSNMTIDEGMKNWR